MDKELMAISETDFFIRHAGEIETSLQLYLQPELVDKEAASWAPGVVGNPTYGTYKKGEQLVEAAVNAVVEMIRDYHSGKLENAFARRQNISPDYKKYYTL